MKLNILSKFFLIIFYCIEGTILLSADGSFLFKTEIITQEDKFNEKYPDLAEGFGLIRQNFQDFILEKMLGHDVYEKVETDSGQTVSLLDKTLNEAQSIVIKRLCVDFFTIIEDAIKNNTDLHEIEDPLFSYVLQYDFFQPALKTYLNTYKNIQGQVLFVAALEQNNLQIAQFLLDLGADINLISSCKDGTPLMYAAKNNKEDAFQFLLDLETIDVNKINALGDTVLHILAEKNMLEVIDLLFSHPELNITIKNKMGNTPLDLAVQCPLQKGIRDVALILLHHKGLDMDESDTTKVLYYAVCNEHELVIKKMIELGYNVNSPTEDCRDLLYKAVDLGLFSISKLLLNAGARMHDAHCENKSAYDLAMEDLPSKSLNVEKKARQDIKKLFMQHGSS